MVNAASISCPRCGVLFRAYRIKRLIFWLSVLIAAGWALHHHVAWHVPLARYVMRQ
jgi:hypothetical protein